MLLLGCCFVVAVFCWCFGCLCFSPVCDLSVVGDLSFISDLFLCIIFVSDLVLLFE